jgi:hypothetical protein
MIKVEKSIVIQKLRTYGFLIENLEDEQWH